MRKDWPVKGQTIAFRRLSPRPAKFHENLSGRDRQASPICAFQVLVVSSVLFRYTVRNEILLPLQDHSLTLLCKNVALG